MSRHTITPLLRDRVRRGLIRALKRIPALLFYVCLTGVGFSIVDFYIQHWNFK